MKHHKMHHSHHEMKGMHGAHGQMEHGTDSPHGGKLGGMAHNLVDADDFKKQASSTAYGQAGMAGVKSDEKKIHAQFKHCYDDPGAGGY